MAKELPPVLKIIGVMMWVMGVLMMIPALVDLAAQNADWKVFAVSGVASLFIGIAMVLAYNDPIHGLNIRQALLVTNFAWFGLAMTGALPFMLSHLQLSFTDGFFESMSGITTTGATVLTNLDDLPPGLQLWRGMLQWMGGIGIIVTGLSLLPILNIGGMQMFKVESFELEGKVMPRATQISAGITAIYLLMTLACAFALWQAGMTGLEAVVHAMTTISTGGFSTSDASVGHFDSASIDTIITIGMIAGGIPFLAYLRLFQGDRRSFVRDEQIRAYLTILALSALLVALWLVLVKGLGMGAAIRYAAFNITSVMTGAGYSSTDYGLWGAFPVALIAILTVVGGCAGSTACGMKVFRFQVLFRAAIRQVRKPLSPRALHPLRYRGNLVDQEMIGSILGFFYLFMLTIAGLAIALSATGLDFVTAFSGAATAVANVGPGLGPIIGPSGTFQSLSDTAKWLLIFGMLVGRLEIFTVYVLFSRYFWRW